MLLLSLNILLKNCMNIRFNDVMSMHMSFSLRKYLMSGFSFTKISSFFGKYAPFFSFNSMLSFGQHELMTMNLSFVFVLGAMNSSIVSLMHVSRSFDILASFHPALKTYVPSSSRMNMLPITSNIFSIEASRIHFQYMRFSFTS